jgi:hypothetical protein
MFFLGLFLLFLSNKCFSCFRIWTTANDRASDKVQQDNTTIVHTPHTYDGNQDDRGKDRDDDTTPITCKHEWGLLFLFVVDTVHPSTSQTPSPPLAGVVPLHHSRWSHDIVDR